MRFVTKLCGLTLLFAMLFGVGSFYADAKDVINNDKSATGHFFVLIGMSGTMEGDKLTLNTVPYVAYFAFKPEQKKGQMSLGEFVEGWKAQENSINTDPPNIVLSIHVMGKNEKENFVVMLQNPSIVGPNRASFTINMLKGTVPKDFKQFSLFIGPIEQWTEI